MGDRRSELDIATRPLTQEDLSCQSYEKSPDTSPSNCHPRKRRRGNENGARELLPVENDFSSARFLDGVEEHASEFQGDEGLSRPEVEANEGVSSPQRCFTEIEDSHHACEAGANYPSPEDGEEGAIDSRSTHALVVVGDSEEPPKGNEMECSRKRKMAVFAAAGAVIALQTLLVAMPEIWQPLEEDDSSERVAYQEGLHSWFGALNRAAWLLATANGSGDGGWWVKPRTSVWFNTHLMNSTEDDRWLTALRMRRKTFLWICNSLEVHVRKQDTRLRPSIPVTVRVGATIYRLVNGVDYFDVAEKFGVGESSVHEILQDCVPAIVRVFGHYLRWPNSEAMAEVSRAFVAKCGLPNCQGALGSTHVEILNPSGPEAEKFINRTGHFSLVLQAVVDPSLRFLDVYCGHPERTYNNKVLRCSTLHDRALAGEILAGPIQLVNGSFQLRPYLLGSSSYPLLPWVMVPYPENNELTYCQELFMDHLDTGRIVVQEAFAILKRVFRILAVGLRGRLELAPMIVQACCLIHNILIRRQDIDVDRELERSGSLTYSEDYEEGYSEPGGASSVEIRNQLSEFVAWS